MTGPAPGLTWRHAFNSATGYEHQQTFLPACCGKIVAHLLPVEVYHCRSRFNVALPIDDHIDIVAPVKRHSIRDTANIDSALPRRLRGEYRHFR